MSAPLVSVLIPCFNAGAFLKETIASALGQTHSNLEIILVDDGSSDESLAIARGFEPRIRVLTGPQRGASAARDLATRESSGEFLQYLDADDLLLPEAVASRVQRLQESSGDVACADWRRLIQTGEDGWEKGKLEIADYHQFSDSPDLAVLNGFWAPPAALLYRRSAVERTGGWNPTLPVIQDVRFLFDVAYMGGTFVHVSGESAHYRQHSAGSLSSRSSARFWSDVLRNNLEIERLLKGAGRLDAPRRAAIGRSFALGTRVSFAIDRDLFHANLSELNRFSDQPRSKYLRAATIMERLFGHDLAVKTMRFLRPGLQK
jgi:glycosyltransferase involved in cell wall biosynthesis